MNQIQHRLGFYEDKTTELKEKFSNTLLKVISAFSNYHDGKIFIGVNDNGLVVGVSDIDQEILRIENAINDSIKPKPYYELSKRIVDGLEIIEVRVLCGEHQPYMYKGIAYARSNTASIPVDQQELKKLIMKGKNIFFDSMLVEGNNQYTFQFLRSKLTERIGIERLDEDILRTLGLMKNDKYTNAASLLSDKPDILSASIDLVRFAGTNVSQIIDRKRLIDMSIIEQFEECMKFYEKHINVQERITGAYRETIAEVPLVAFREAVANAIVHRDYSHIASSRIEIYDNRIVVCSSGGLPYGINEDEYINGTVSVPRNYIITDVFLRLGIIEKLATGIRRIKEAYSGRKSTPEFIVNQNSVLMILPKEKVVEVDTVITLNSVEELIVNYLKVHTEIRRGDVESLINKGKTTSANLLSKMVDKGILIKMSSGRNAYYKLR